MRSDRESKPHSAQRRAASATSAVAIPLRRYSGATIRSTTKGPSGGSSHGDSRTTRMAPTRVPPSHAPTKESSVVAPKAPSKVRRSSSEDSMIASAVKGSPYASSERIASVGTS